MRRNRHRDRSSTRGQTCALSPRSDMAEFVDGYHLHDARMLDDVFPRTEFIDVTITSPPYWNLKNYGSRQQIGFGQTYSNYLEDIQTVFAGVHARTKSTGSLWIISDTFKQNGELILLPFDISERMRQIGWVLQDVIIWQKDKALPWSHQGKLRNIFEYVALYSKSRKFKYHLAGVRDVSDVKDYWVRYPERYSPEGKTPSRNWTFPIPRQGAWGKARNYVKHACPLPPALVERMLRLTSDRGDIVFDPFAGSGSVLASAHAMGRRYVGFDLSRKYKSMFRSKVLPAVAQDYERRTAQTNGQERVRQRFGALILSLRTLKYPKELVRLYRQSWRGFQCDLVLAIRGRSHDSLHLVFVCPRNGTSPQTVIKRATRISAKAPLSKFGLEVEIDAITRHDFSEDSLAVFGLRPRSSLKVYRDGRFYAWNDRVTVQTLCEAMKNGGFTKGPSEGYPPILSTLAISIDPKRPEKAFEDNNAEG